jgi:hypothetical protein
VACAEHVVPEFQMRIVIRIEDLVKSIWDYLNNCFAARTHSEYAIGKVTAVRGHKDIEIIEKPDLFSDTGR